MRPRSELQTARRRASTLQLTNQKEKVKTIPFATSKQRSNSCLTQYNINKTLSQSPRTPIDREYERSSSPQQKYKDQTYFYKNLHHKKLWTWKHPMDYCEFKQTPKSRPCKVSISVLERFKNYMQKRVRKRVPLTVEDILKQTSNQH